MGARDIPTGTPDRARRLELCGIPVTLDGQPARISGASLTFPRVALVSNGLGCEWAWSTVEHIVVNRGGRFAL